ncbi:MAG: TonB-dependent receptor [Bacteroidales bacterium]|nr:TonB-dependent receptor [Bacteroidales bacterium]
MSVFKRVLITALMMLGGAQLLFAQGTFKGTITDKKTGEPIPFVNVQAKQNGQMIGGAQTNFDGIFTMKGLAVDAYDIEVSCVGYQGQIKTGVNLKASGFTVVNFEMEAGAATLKPVEISTSKAPIVDVGDASTVKRITSDDIAKMPGGSVESIVAAVGGVGFSDGGTSTARGEDNMVTIVGGARKRTGVSVPKEAISQIEVVLGGTPASIGEAIGGTQIITLKPPQSQFKGLVKYETYLDYRLANTLSVYLTGPIYKKKIALEGGGISERPLIGFRFNGTGSYSKFAYYRPKDGRYRVVKDEKVAEMEENPLVYDPVENSVNYAGEYLRDDDFVSIRRPNARNYYISSDREANFARYSVALEGAVDFRFSDYATLTLTGEFDYSHAPNTSLSYFPLNLTRAANNTSVYNNMVFTIDYTQRFPDNDKPVDQTLPDAKTSVTDIMYNITAMYNRESSRSFNERFGDDVFKYGHVGTFVTTRMPSYKFESDYDYNGTSRSAYVQDSWRSVVTSFTPSEYNPNLSNYTSQLYRIEEVAPYLQTFENILSYKGLINGSTPSSIYGMFNNVGTQVNSYGKSVANYFYAQAKASANIGKNEIEVGFQFDRYNSSSYSLSASSLWTLMRQLTNAHISMLDFTKAEVTERDGMLYVNYPLAYGQGQTTFDESLRKAFGLEKESTLWLDVDSKDPQFYQDNGGLSMFSSSDLFNSGNSYVGFYGYDHTGKKYSSRGWGLDDFFDPESKDHKNFQYLPAFSPTYMAGYIQDKFFFQDLIFNVGVRVDYFDGNQMVLKDPYLLYESYTVGDLKGSSIAYNTGLENNEFAVNAQDDWVVYVDDPGKDEPTIRGYRSGSTWYDANGVELSSYTPVNGEAGRPTPYRTRSTDDHKGGQEIATTGNGSGYKISKDAFDDYKPQVVVMPRIAFSFPVGERSQFKASYDIIARRPSSGWQADYLSYMNMTLISSISNPNLKPERVTNYELGFEQQLNDNSGIGISAYYKETRDLIQLVQYAGADPNNNYFSYDNIDFKTVKGLTLSYDLRHTKHIRVNANYTLQYAEGTGLTTTTMSELIREGYTTLKMLNPIADDRRHEFKASIDFRYGSGAAYDGPRWTRAVKDKKTGEVKKKEVLPLQNFGVNLLAVAQSGRPYTRAFSNTQNTIVGRYRGARLPWGFYFNAVVDKSWPITIKRTNKDGKVKSRPTLLNAAITVNNIFDIRNITGVFSVTGNPTSNGYLTDPEVQSIINTYLDPQSFRDMYSISLRNSNWLYSSPRTIKLALTYSF